MTGNEKMNCCHEPTFQGVPSCRSSSTTFSILEKVRKVQYMSTSTAPAEYAVFVIKNVLKHSFTKMSLSEAGIRIHH